MRELTIKENDAGQRLDKFLTKSLKGLPVSLMYKYIRLKKIKVNAARAQQSQMLAAGDVVRLYIPEEFFPDSKQTPDIAAGHAPAVSVIYEDENILLADKRIGLLAHEDEDGDSNNLLNGIKAYLCRKGEYNPGEEQSFSVSLCNRIDRNTGGIVIAAKNARALRFINEEIRKGTLRKKYICAVHGIPGKKSETLTAYLVKDEKTKKVRIYNEGNQPPYAKKIITKYTVLKTKPGSALLEVELLTGRTHQIRAQMAAVGHPLLGDGKYGLNKADRKNGYKHQALYSYCLRFDFPESGGEFDYLSGREFTVPKEKIWFCSDYN